MQLTTFGSPTQRAILIARSGILDGVVRDGSQIPANDQRPESRAAFSPEAEAHGEIQKVRGQPAQAEEEITSRVFPLIASMPATPNLRTLAEYYIRGLTE